MQVPEDEQEGHDTMEQLKKEVDIFKDFTTELENSQMWRIKIKKSITRKIQRRKIFLWAIELTWVNPYYVCINNY